MVQKITVPALRARKASAGQGERLALVTAYDATFARMLDRAGVDAMLVGDSLGMVIQGGTSTLPVTLDEIIYHGRAVARGTQRAHLIGDMPFLSYHTGVDQAVANAGRLLKDGGFESVKLEGGREIADIVHRMVRMGIPVVGHVGLLPQRVHALGGFKVQGKTADAAEDILEDAMALVEAGAFLLVIEGVPAPLAERITRAVEVPTVGIGAGVGCDGQILVSYDLLGLNDTLRPKFVKRYDNFFERGVEAVQTYISEVRDGAFPGPEHSFGLAPAPAPAPSPSLSTAAETALDRAPAYGPTQ